MLRALERRARAQALERIVRLEMLAHIHKSKLLTREYTAPKTAWTQSSRPHLFRERWHWSCLSRGKCQRHSTGWLPSREGHRRSAGFYALAQRPRPATAIAGSPGK